MASLTDDLATYADEFYTNGDLEAGKKLAIEICGAGTLVLFGTGVLSVIVPVMSWTMIAQVARVTANLAKAYAELGAEDRKKVRAVVSWLKGGFNLGERLLS